MHLQTPDFRYNVHPYADCALNCPSKVIHCEANMAEVYCTKCHALMDDKDFHCKKCKRPNANNPVQLAIGSMLVVGSFGLMITAIYAYVMSLAWPRWQLVFESKGISDSEAAQRADTAAWAIGFAVFLLSSLLCVLAIRSNGKRIG
jgi:hypothetical protein